MIQIKNGKNMNKIGTKLRPLFIYEKLELITGGILPWKYYPAAL